MWIYIPFPLNRKGAAWRNANSRSGARNEKDKPQTSCVWKQGSYQTPRVLQENIRADLKELQLAKNGIWASKWIMVAVD